MCVARQRSVSEAGHGLSIVWLVRHSPSSTHLATVTKQPPRDVNRKCGFTRPSLVTGGSFHGYNEGFITPGTCWFLFIGLQLTLDCVYCIEHCVIIYVIYYVELRIITLVSWSNHKCCWSIKIFVRIHFSSFTHPGIKNIFMLFVPKNIGYFSNFAMFNLDTRWYIKMLQLTFSIQSILANLNSFCNVLKFAFSEVW